MNKVKLKIISNFYIFYIWILSKTCKVRIINDEKIDINNSVVGFWHGKSFATYLLFDFIKNVNLGAVITSDPRGEYIGNICNYFGIMPLRIPNGAKARYAITDIIEYGKNDGGGLIGFSIDGPLGPRFEPKKMVYHIAYKTGKKYVAVNIDSSKKIVAKNRWDKYEIPLPFATITFTYKYGKEILKDDLRDFENFKETIKKVMGT